MGGIGKTIGQIGSIAGNFIPGPWGTALKVGGALLAGSGQQKQANGYNDQAGQLASMYAGNAERYYPALFQSLLSQAGVDPATGVANPGAMANGIADPLISRYSDNLANQQGNAMGSAQMAMGGRGFNGANSMSPQLTAMMSRGFSQDAANNRRQTGIDTSNMMFSRLMQAMGALNPGNSQTLQNVGGYYSGQAANSQNAATAALAGGGGSDISGLISSLFGHHQPSSNLDGSNHADWFAQGNQLQ